MATTAVHGQVPLGTSPSSNKNYILTTTYLDSFYSVPSNPTTAQAMQDIGYVDGMGRSVQAVQVKGIPGASKDLVAPVV